MDARHPLLGGPIYVGGERLGSLSVVLPCRDEEQSIGGVVLDALRVGRALTDDLEVLVVDDASTDRSRAILIDIARAHPELRVIDGEARGYGAALVRAFRGATKEWVFYTDADGQFALDDLVALVPMLGQYDVVSAYRAPRNDGRRRALLGYAWSWLVNQVFHLGLRDIDCAFKIYPGAFVRDLPVASRGATVDAEMLLAARRAGLRVGQVGVRHFPRQGGASSGARPSVAWTALRELHRLGRRNAMSST